jgi:hypothetical protein
MTTPNCTHEWSRFLSDPFRCVCVVCGEPFPDEPPVRSFSDIDIERHEEPDHSPGWEEFGATPGTEEIARARRDVA